MGCNKMLIRGESYKKFLNRTCANIFALQQKAQLNANRTFTLTHINLQSSANWLVGLSEFHGSLPHFPEPQRVSPLTIGPEFAYPVITTCESLLARVDSLNFLQRRRLEVWSIQISHHNIIFFFFSLQEVKPKFDLTLNGGF